MGSTIKGKNLLLEEQILSIKGCPLFEGEAKTVVALVEIISQTDEFLVKLSSKNVCF